MVASAIKCPTNLTVIMLRGIQVVLIQNAFVYIIERVLR